MPTCCSTDSPLSDARERRDDAIRHNDVIRPMRARDVRAVREVSAAALGFAVPDAPGERARMERRWSGRLRHLLRTDPGGAWVADRDGRIAGAAMAFVRDGVWALSLLAVDARAQSGGLGRALLERALEHGDGTPVGLIAASEDPRALRLYANAGFGLRPTLLATGTVRREALPALDRRVRRAGPSDLALTEPVSRHVRGATHLPDLAHLLTQGDQLLTAGDRGFVVHHRGVVRILAARSEPLARALLWAALSESAPEGLVEIRWITGGQDWAVQVALAAGLELRVAGPICVAGAPGPMRPYLPSGSYL